MPTITIIPVALDELFTLALDQARRARTMILRLSVDPLVEGETISGRAIEIARHAIALADAFTVIDQLADSCATSPSKVSKPSEPQANDQGGLN